MEPAECAIVTWYGPPLPSNRSMKEYLLHTDVKSYLLKISCYRPMFEIFKFSLFFWILLSPSFMELIGKFHVNVWLEGKIKSYKSNFDLIFH